MNVCLLSVIRKQWQYNYYIDQSEFLTRFWTDFRSSVWNIHNFHINQNAPYLPPKILHNYRLRFLLGGLQYPGAIGNNGYAKFGGGGNKVHYGICENVESVAEVHTSLQRNVPSGEEREGRAVFAGYLKRRTPLCGQFTWSQGLLLVTEESNVHVGARKKGRRRKDQLRSAL